jgi:hypothetical protein
LELFQKAMQFYGKLQTDGLIERFETVILTHHGGDLNGFTLLYGNAGKLAEVLEHKDFVEITVEAGYCLEGFGIIPGFTGEGLMNILSQWSKLIGS